MKKLEEEIVFGPEVAPGVRVALRRRGDEVREVLARALKDGEPLQPGAEVGVVGVPSREHPWHELTPLYKHGEHGETLAAGTGPAQVATPAYREGFDRIFGKKAPVGLA